MNIFILVDENGNEIVKRQLKDGENHADVFREYEDKLTKQLRYGN